jgi:hypothetical protein
MDDNPERGRGHFTQDEFAAMWRGHLTPEELAEIKKETDDRINGWIDKLSPEEADAWVAAYADDLERSATEDVFFKRAEFGFVLDHAQVIPLKVVVGCVLPFHTGIVPGGADYSQIASRAVWART